MTARGRGSFWTCVPLALVACAPAVVAPPVAAVAVVAPPVAVPPPPPPRAAAKPEPVRQPPLQPREPVPDEPFRAHAPALTPIVEVLDPPPRVTTLANGLRVVLFPRHAVPLAEVRLVIDRGALDLGDLGGLAVNETEDFFRRLGDDAVYEEVSTKLSAVGGCWESGHSHDGVWVAVKIPSAGLDAAVAALSRGFVHAFLAPAEHEMRSREWTHVAGSAAITAEHAERLILFGTRHPYGYGGEGATPISQQAAQKVHDQLFQPAHATLVVVGDVDAAALDASVTRQFGAWVGWKPVAKVRVAPPEVPATPVLVAAPAVPAARHVMNGRRASPSPSAPQPAASPLLARLSVVSNSAADQRYGAVIARGPAPTSADLDAFRLAVELIGGAVSSTLYERLRQDGDALSLSAGVEVERTATWLELGAYYAPRKAVDGVEQVLRAIRAVRTGAVTDSDITTAREALLGSFRAHMATVEGAASLYSQGGAQDLERVRNFPARLARIRRSDVIRVANTYLRAEALHVLFVGNSSELDVAPLGLGPAVTIMQAP